MFTNLIVTAYCHCALCCGVANQPTASGLYPVPGITVATARSIPFGTRVHIAGIGWRKVQDRTAKRFDGRIDIFMSSHAEAKRFGKKNLEIFFPQK